MTAAGTATAEPSSPTESKSLENIETVCKKASDCKKGNACVEGRCRKICEGDRNISTAAEFSAFAGEQCEVVSGHVIISKTDLQTLDGLGNLVQVGGLEISANAQLNDLDALLHLTRIDGPLIVGRNGALSTLKGLENVRRIGGLIAVEFNPLLTDLAALRHIRHVDNDLLIRVNQSLSSLSDLREIASITGTLILHSNDNGDLSGLAGLKTVGGDVTIVGSYALRSLNGLSSLEEIGGKLSIMNGSALNDLNGLKNVTRLKGGILVTGTAVRTIRPLLGWPADAVTGPIVFYANSNLPKCEVTQFATAQIHPTAECPTNGLYTCMYNDGVNNCAPVPKATPQNPK